MINLEKISPDIVKNKYPNFYCESTQYYLMIKNDISQGLYALTNTNKNTAYVSITVFEPFRFKFLSKSIIINMIDIPFSLGYKSFFTCTKWESWVKVLKRFEEYGLYLVKNNDLSSDETWFFAYRS